MSSLEQALAVLSQHGIALRGSLVQDGESGNLFFANVELTRDSRGRREPSHVQLRSVTDALSQIGIEVHYLFSDASMEGLESGLRATLLVAFPEFVRNAFCSTAGKTAQVWIEPKTQLPPSTRKAIQDRVDRYFALSETSVGPIALLTDENLPGKLALLSAVRVLAPTNVASLRLFLQGRGLTVPSDDWVNRRMDALRKSGDVVPVNDRRYCLSSKAVRNLGTRRDSDSPDITRMLALARRSL